MGTVRKERLAAGGSLRIGLFDSGMTALHRVGLGGLWITLKAIELDHPDLCDRLRGHGSWTLGPREVELTWRGDGTAFFGELIRESFRLSEDGRLWFLGLGHPDDHEDRGVTLQEAVLSTFLQHGKNRKADPSNKPSGLLAFEIDERREAFQYRRIGEYEHQRARFDPIRPGPVVGWLFPGGAVRHTAFASDTGLTEPPGPWLALLFGAVGAVYFRIQARSGGIRPQFCIVVPEVTDLPTYREVRASFAGRSVGRLVVAGAADAALRALIPLARVARTWRTVRCQVISYGVAQWATQQKTRAEVFEIAGEYGTEVRVFAAAEQLLLPVLRLPPRAASAASAESSRSQPYWEMSPALDLAARNLAQHQPWWRGFSELVIDTQKWGQMESYRLAVLGASKRERRGGLSEMVVSKDAFHDQQGAETIVRACHAAWRSRMGQLSEQSKDTGERFEDLLDREFERLRIKFSHCKNASSLRAALTDFWARAGAFNPELQRGWQEVVPYLTEDRWPFARDLALLALVSYSAPKGEGSSRQDGRSGV